VVARQCSKLMSYIAFEEKHLTCVVLIVCHTIKLDLTTVV